MASMVCSLLGLPSLILFPFATVGLVGLGLGIAGVVAISRDHARSLRGKGMAIAGIIFGTLSLLFAAVNFAIMLPAFEKVRESARRLKGSANLRQIGIALNAYSAANAGWYPETAQGWQDRLIAMGIADLSLFDSPQIEGAASDELVYLPPGDLAAVPNPSNIIVVHEDLSRVRSREVNALLLDGQTLVMTPEQLRDVLKRQNRK
ncbi:MAG: DUF4190 domain-containing protein [Phycisphaerales bacterium]